MRRGGGEEEEGAAVYVVYVASGLLHLISCQFGNGGVHQKQ